MSYILKNDNLEIHVDPPMKGYEFSRFDWTGKISKVKYQGIQVSANERTDSHIEDHFGKGFYNEFGIDHALGFDEAEIGDWFHKIGIGLLKKEDDRYEFHKKYEVRPAEFDIVSDSNKLSINCLPETVNGYSYVLRKGIELQDSGFKINYHLKNTGEKDIITDEYVHNFMAINHDFIGTRYKLKFPFTLNSELFGDIVNPEKKVSIKKKHIKFSGTPEDQFFFSNLTGNKKTHATWELKNVDCNMGISETPSFQTDKVNLWGWKHVISPELFYKINIAPGQSTEWSRNYKIYHLN